MTPFVVRNLTVLPCIPTYWFSKLNCQKPQQMPNLNIHGSHDQIC